MTNSHVGLYKKSAMVFVVLSLGGVATQARAATYQSENYTKTSGCRYSSAHSGYTGSGFVDMGGKGTWFESNGVEGGSGGRYTVIFRYASTGSKNPECRVFVNGVSAGTVRFAPTGKWTSWATDAISVTLRRGLNTIRVEAKTTAGGPNLDKMTVTSGSTKYSLETHGEQNLAVVLLDYVNDGSARSIDEIEDGYFYSKHSVASFIKEVSYGKTTLTGDVFGWIVPKKDLYGTGWTSCWPTDQDRFNLLLRAYPEVNLDEYDGFVFYVNRPPNDECAFGVSTTIGIQSIETYTSFGTIDTRISYDSTDFYFPYQAYSYITNSTAAHEIIHSLGFLGHSNSYTCGNQVLSSNSDKCTVNAYGDIFSIMGLRSQSSFPDAVVSENLGWLDGSTITTVDTGGVYKIFSLESPEQNIKALKIPLAKPIDMGGGFLMDYIYLEYRAMTGFDKRDAWSRRIALRNGTSKTIENIHGVLVHGANCGKYDYCLPYLLNMHPNSVDAHYPPNQVAQAYLYEGETFRVPNNSIAIKVLDVVEQNYIEVEVNMTKALTKVAIIPGLKLNFDALAEEKR